MNFTTSFSLAQKLAMINHLVQEYSAYSDCMMIEIVTDTLHAIAYNKPHVNDYAILRTIAEMIIVLRFRGWELVDVI